LIRCIAGKYGPDLLAPENVHAARMMVAIIPVYALPLNPKFPDFCYLCPEFQSLSEYFRSPSSGRTVLVLSLYMRDACRRQIRLSGKRSTILADWIMI